MERLKKFLDEHRGSNTLKSRKFENFTQISVKIEENYLVDKANTFTDIIPEKSDMLHVLISFVKVIQRTLHHDNLVFIRFWRDIKNERRGAYTIYVTDIDDSINDDFNDLCRCDILDTQSVNLNMVLSHYNSICCDKIETLFNDIGDSDSDSDSDGGGLELDDDSFLPILVEEEEEAREKEYEKIKIFTKVFSYENTNKMFEDGDYVPVVDFMIRDPLKSFFWEAFGRSTFPWYYFNEFEKEANRFMKKIEIEQGKFNVPMKSLELLSYQYKCCRFDWKTKNQIEYDIDKKVKHIRGFEDEDEDTDEDEDEDEDDDNLGPKERRIRKRKNNKNKRKIYLREKNSRKSPSTQYFNNKKKFVPKPDRIFTMTVNELGPYQYLKETLNLLKAVINFVGVDYEKRRKIFDDFWISQPIQTQLPKAVFAVYKKFKQRRISFNMIVLNKRGGIVYNILEHLICTSQTVIGLRNTAPQYLLQMISRDTAFNNYDTLGYNVYVAGPPSSGKSHCMLMLGNSSILETIAYNSMTSSGKAGLGKKNPDNYKMVIDTDAGPIFTELWDKLNPEQKKKVKAKIAEMSEGETHYSVFVPGGDSKKSSNDPFDRRGDTVRIINENKGPKNIIGNLHPTIPEFIDRVNIVDVASNNKEFGAMLCKIADELANSFSFHNNLKSVFFDFMKEMQADLALYFLYKNSDISKAGTSFNLVAPMMISMFCMGKMKEKNPFFINSPRKINSLMFIALTLCAYKTKILLSNLQHSKYYKQEYIKNVSEYCYEFEKRMIVGYQEIIPALFIMLPQYVDVEMMNILKVIKEDILYFKSDYNEDLKEYFDEVVMDETNQLNQYEVDFRRMQNNVKKKKKFGFNRDFNRWSSTEDDVNNENEDTSCYLDINFLVFKTEKSKGEFGKHINILLEKRFGKKLSLETILNKLNKLKDFSWKIETYYKPVKLSLNGENCYNGSGFVVEVDSTKSNENVSTLFQRYDNQTKRSLWRFPVELMKKLDGFSSYGILKDIVVNELPYKNQGNDDIQVCALNFQTLQTEVLGISPNKDSSDNFEMDNPKKMSESERRYYSILKGHIPFVDDKSNDNMDFFKSLITKDKLSFDHPLIDISIDYHKKFFSGDEIDEVLDEEEDLIYREVYSDDLKNKLYKYNKSKSEEYSDDSDDNVEEEEERNMMSDDDEEEEGESDNEGEEEEEEDMMNDDDDFDKDQSNKLEIPILD